MQGVKGVGCERQEGGKGAPALQGKRRPRLDRWTCVGAPRMPSGRSSGPPQPQLHMWPGRMMRRCGAGDAGGWHVRVPATPGASLAATWQRVSGEEGPREKDVGGGQGEGQQGVAWRSLTALVASTATSRTSPRARGGDLGRAC